MVSKFDGLKIYTLDDIQKKTGISKQTLRKYIKAGTLKARKISRKWFVTQDALKEFFERND